MTGLQMIDMLHNLVKESRDPPSNTFVYATLAEMSRIADLLVIYAANREDELPDSVLYTWLYLAD